MNTLNVSSANYLSQKSVRNNNGQYILEDRLFQLFELTSSNQLSSSGEKMNIFIFFLNGDFKIRSKYFDNYNITNRGIITIPRMCEFIIEHSENSELIILGYNDPSSEGSRKILNALRTKIDHDKIKTASLEQREAIISYLELLKNYCLIDKPCEEMHQVKKEEFYILLRCLYSDYELAHFFYPILIETCSFRQYILDNYENVSSVQDLVSGLNMSKSVFYERFKKEFGVSAKQWLTEKLKERILKRISNLETTIKDLIYEFNFSSAEHFNSFCKKHYGKTPAKLIEEIQRKDTYGRGRVAS